MCYVDKENPIEVWDALVRDNKRRCDELNKYQIKQININPNKIPVEKV